MSFTVFLGNLPAWVTADDIKGWLSAENLVADAIKVIRNPETQESKGFAFIEAPNTEEMNSIIRRFDRAPLEDRLLRANPAQPPKAKGPIRPGGAPQTGGFHAGGGPSGGQPAFQPTFQRGGPRREYGHSGAAGPAQSGATQSAPLQTNVQATAHPPTVQADTPSPAQGPAATVVERPPRRGKKSGKRPGGGAPPSAFAEELAKVL
jgi:RNA recognition motif-containing protein